MYVSMCAYDANLYMCTCTGSHHTRTLIKDAGRRKKQACHMYIVSGDDTHVPWDSEYIEPPLHHCVDLYLHLQ